MTGAPFEISPFGTSGQEPAKMTSPLSEDSTGWDRLVMGWKLKLVRGKSPGIKFKKTYWIKSVQKGGLGDL